MRLWVWCWNQDAIIAVDVGRVSSTRKSTNESVKDQGDAGCVFWWERHCPSWVCTMWSDGKQTVVPGIFSVFEGCCVQEKAWIVRKPDLDVAPWQCARLTHHSSSAIIWQNIRHPLCPPADFLLFSKLKTTLKGRRFQTIEEIQENAIRELCTITESAFQEAFQQWKKHWELCIASRGDYFEGDSA